MPIQSSQYSDSRAFSRRSKIKRRYGLALAAVFMLCGAASLSGCTGGGGDAAAVSKPGASERIPAGASPQGTSEAGVKGTAPAVQAKQPFAEPLTGLPAEGERKDRPVMVMVENSPQARPQSGLDQADIVYEVLAEGEITRFLAVYQSQSPSEIGPVRSIRPYFVEIGDGLDAVLVHAGWSQDAINMIAKRNLAHFDEVYGDGTYYWRSDERKMPHNLYTGIDKIRRGIANKKLRNDWNGPILAFLAPGKSAAGTPASHVTIPYLRGYNVSYDYDAGAGIYKRSMEGKPHLDAATQKQLTADNVLIVEAKHQVLDNEGRRDVDVFGPGHGVLLQKGKRQDIVWERKGGLIRAYADGEEQPLVPGRTWVQIVPEGTKLDVK
ncbi:DUF3048 domain-containing protein [Paenibacillus sp. MBLB4367]|uniref:DUF3048 domain-containing protein n=1 Tax=Paenibacillus sp. MBLB4367 TaxID=3384767 RepID=UPI0039081DEF